MLGTRTEKMKKYVPFNIFHVKIGSYILREVKNASYLACVVRDRKNCIKYFDNK